MSVRLPVFAVAAIGAPLLTVLELRVLVAVVDPAPLGAVAAGLVLAAGQATWVAGPRLGAAKAAAAAATAVLVLFAIFLLALSIGLHNHPPS